MNTPKFAPSLKGLAYEGLAKKLASVVAFYKKYPSQAVPVVRADDPESSKRKKS